jgi:hypothetical protein
VADLHQRAEHVRRVNDIFFLILMQDATLEEVCSAIAVLAPAERALLSRFKLADCLQTIRTTEVCPSEKIFGFLDVLSEDVGLDIAHKESVKGCLDALKAREAAGAVNALLVKTGNNGALVIPLHIKVQPGNGQIHSAVASSDDFEATLTRARLALLARGFLRAMDDVICTLDLTEPHYFGTSIGLAAAVSMYGAARGLVNRPVYGIHR